MTLPEAPRAETRARMPRNARLLGGVRRLELQPAPPTALRTGLLRIAVILVGLVVGAVFLALQPGVGSRLFSITWTATFGSTIGLSSVVALTTPLLLTGAAVAVAARGGLWNIGVEGQLFMGAWTATAVAFSLPDLPPAVLVVVMLVAGCVGGGIWALVPAIAKAYANVSEIVTTLMLNFVAISWAGYWITGPWTAEQLQGSGSLSSRPLPDGVELPQMTIGGVTVGIGLLLALGSVLTLWAIFRYTRFGFHVDLTGTDERTALYAGVRIRRTTIATLVISGAVGGLTGAVMELDQLQSFSAGLSSNSGYIGIVVAVLAAGSLAFIAPMAALMAALAATGVALQIAGVSVNAVLCLIGVLMLLAASSARLAHRRIVWRRPAEDPVEARVEEVQA